jgi:nitrile hydratase subunit alpha
MPGNHKNTLSEIEIRVKALESLLVEKGYVKPAALEAIIDTYENKIGPRSGAQVVARAWKEPQFKQWLLADATAAIASMGFTGRQGEHMICVENTAKVHNLVVCTLCSCYPWAVLGIPPVWYKAPAYRARAVIDPRGIMKEFGCDLPSNVEIAVWDSTAELRYLVLPQPPDDVDQCTQDQLSLRVTRDSMIGVTR